MILSSLIMHHTPPAKVTAPLITETISVVWDSLNKKLVPMRVPAPQAVMIIAGFLLSRYLFCFDTSSVCGDTEIASPDFFISRLMVCALIDMHDRSNRMVSKNNFFIYSIVFGLNIYNNFSFNLLNSSCDITPCSIRAESLLSSSAIDMEEGLL